VNLLVNYGIFTFQDDTQNLATQIMELQTKPDLLVGVCRGGAIPAVYLSHLTGIPVYITNYSLRDQGWGLEQNLLNVIDGLNIMLIDDLIDSGKSMKNLVEFVKGSAASVSVGVLLYNTDIVIDDTKVIAPHKFSRATYPHWFQFWWETDKTFERIC